MKPILLDTHVWLWYAIGENLSKSAKKAILEAEQTQAIYVAAISLWEICMLEFKKRIVLSMPCEEWIKQSILLNRLQIIPLMPPIAAESCRLPGSFHGDPADRLIVASARLENMTIVTRDRQIIQYSHQKYIKALTA